MNSDQYHVNQKIEKTRRNVVVNVQMKNKLHSKQKALHHDNKQIWFCLFFFEEAKQAKLQVQVFFQRRIQIRISNNAFSQSPLRTAERAVEKIRIWYWQQQDGKISPKIFRRISKLAATTHTVPTHLSSYPLKEEGKRTHTHTHNIRCVQEHRLRHSFILSYLLSSNSPRSEIYSIIPLSLFYQVFYDP